MPSQLVTSITQYQLLSEREASLPTCYAAVFQELFEKHLCNQSSYYVNTDNFCYAKPKEAITWYHQINTFLCQQK